MAKFELRTVAKTTCDLPLLRIYWYDAMRLGRPTPEQSALADSNDIKVRLGQINSAGEQKGVDALIITDLAELARNHAITDAVLLSGDEDVRVGVVLAQQFGVRVHLVGIEPSRANQSRSLMQEADTTTEWDVSAIRSFLAYSPPSSPTANSAVANSGLEALIEPMITAFDPGTLATLKSHFASNSQVPSEHDRPLLRIGRLHYGQSSLSDPERTTLRRTFMRLVLAHS
ncbi:NYN domain-containing protein [Muricoccus vinaceus]|uniref:NYN domain-containing protein n=1 Tax=Muricoccus vinaceus TaxID=424704 RepID=A0ABV6IZQ8_9PROT